MPGLARYQDFAKRGGLEPKVKMFSQYVLNWEWVVSKLVLLKCFTERGEGTKLSAAGRFCFFATNDKTDDNKVYCFQWCRNGGQGGQLTPLPFYQEGQGGQYCPLHFSTVVTKRTPANKKKARLSNAE